MLLWTNRRNNIHDLVRWNFFAVEIKAGSEQTNNWNL